MFGTPFIVIYDKKKCGLELLSRGYEEEGEGAISKPPIIIGECPIPSHQSIHIIPSFIAF